MQTKVQTIAQTADLRAAAQAVAGDDIVAGLPHAPLAMPKQVLERSRDGVVSGLLARLMARNARFGG